jgi:DUF1365 family protein
VSNFRPPSAAASLYAGDVMHARMKPVTHRFHYRVFSLLIDLDRLAEADRASALFSVNKRNLVSFHEADHGPGRPSGLATYVRRLLGEAGCDTDIGRVLLLCYPRILGLVFNPLSVYFAYTAESELAGVIYEVRNTFGERHSYVAPVAAGELGPAGLRQQRDKLFYVSPFNGMAMSYRFRVLPPGEAVRLRILESDSEGPLLAATFAGERRDLTSAGLIAAFLRVPMLTAQVVGGIHWEALRLWLKGLHLQDRPPAPPAVSIADNQRSRLLNVPFEGPVP